MKPSDILQRARARIEDPERWCQGRSSDSMGRRCAVGALLAPVESTAELADALMVIGSAADVIAPPGMKSYAIPLAALINDRLGHPAVMAMYDVAISMAMSDEAGE